REAAIDGALALARRRPSVGDGDWPQPRAGGAGQRTHRVAEERKAGAPASAHARKVLDGGPRGHPASREGVAGREGGDRQARRLHAAEGSLTRKSEALV